MFVVQTGSNMGIFKMTEQHEATVVSNPKWMKHPIFVEDMPPFPLNKEITQLLSKTPFDKLLPVQSAMLQYGVSSNKDVYLHTTTGSGKTFAYILLILHLLKNRKIPMLRVIIVVPSKDLVYQVFKSLELFTHLNIVTAGTADINKEFHLLGAADVFISTPNRLVQHLELGLPLNHLYAFIVDEADRLFGWDDWFNAIIPKLPRNNNNGCCQIKQKLGLQQQHQPRPLHPFRLVLVSATLASRNLLVAMDPVYITNVSSHSYHLPEMYHYIIQCSNDTALYKPLYLLSWLREHKNKQILIFCSTVEASIRLTEILKIIIKQQNLNVNADKIRYINGDLTDQQRKTSYAAFEEGEISVLICSDLVARGIDLRVDVVVQYQCATNIKQFVHRVGRTSRGDRKDKGASVLMVDEAGMDGMGGLKYLRKLVPGDEWQQTGCKLLKYDMLVQQPEMVMQAALKALKEKQQNK